MHFRLLAAVLATVAATVPAVAARAAPTNCPDLKPTAQTLHAAVRTHRLPGAAIEVTQPGCRAWTHTEGVADQRTGKPMFDGGRFRIASNTKTFTATVVLQLVAERRIALDAPVERYLPGVIRGNGYDGRAITVRQLLQHTSGLPDHMDLVDFERYEEWRYRHFEPRELVAMALSQPKPAKPWSYSTTNTVLAGMVVKSVTGRPIGTEITRRIIVPLGLRGTYWPGDSPRIKGQHYRGYWPESEGGPGDFTEVNVSLGDAGGALISTLPDENRFFAALLGGRLLPAAQLAEMKRTVPADPDRLWPGARYGLGLISTPLPCGGRYWGHGGTFPGYASRGGITEDGRSAQLVVTQVPNSFEADQALMTTYESALCATR